MAQSEDFRSLVDLASALARDIPDLFQSEIRLVRAEARETVDLLLAALGRLAAGSAVAVGAVGVLLAAAVSWTTMLLIGRGIDSPLAGTLGVTLVALVAILVAWFLFASAVRRLHGVRDLLDGRAGILAARATTTTGGHDGER